MCFLDTTPTVSLPAADPFADIPPRQLTALSLRFGGPVPASYAEIAREMGNSRPAAHKLVRKALKRLNDAGIPPACLTGRAA